MVIRRTGSRTVEGLPGWEVRENFPWYLEYREQGRAVRFSAEMASGPDVSIILYDEPHNTRWEPPHQDVKLTAPELHPILVRATASVLLLGIRPVWETMPAGAERADWPVIWAEAAALLRRAEQ